MTDDDQHLPSRQAIAAKDRSAKLTVTGKLARAIALMVWEGARRQDAAASAGLKDHSLRAALKKVHVLRHYHQELGVLRESTRAKNFHRLDQIAGDEDAGNTMSRVAAIKTMEAISNEHLAPGARGMGGARAGYLIDLSEQTVPGLVIVVNTVQPAPRHLGDDAIDITPADDDS